MHTLWRGVPSPEQIGQAYTDDAYARVAKVSRRDIGPTYGLADDRAVQRAHVHDARGGDAHRPRHRPRGAGQCGALQVLRQEFSRRVFPHRAFAGAHGRQAV